ncbi:DUF2125 domain-containing protein [Sediminimonas qiaohouensis]|uniref:DUF2125 domain-containing protein n=1 Tax=Sediminimonas qiaohouensis TaxID=552061 RepID=UPI00041FF968|nr:DUF2125 domain-containing protein [Sediminimonas qiaohouensis]
MKRLLILIAMAAGLWSGYWVWGAQTLKSDIANWFDTRRAEGWVADYTDLSVAGFPNRLDATLDAPSLADPGTGWAWQAPFFQVLRLSYDADHRIAVWPDRQMVSTPHNKYDLTSADMRASIITRGTDAALERATLVADTVLVARHGAEGGTAMTALNLAIKAQPDAPATYRVSLTADDLAPPAQTRRRIAPQEVLPHRFDALTADMTVTLTRPLDRRTLEQDRPQPTRIDIGKARAQWGDMVLEAAGTLQIDDQGRADGRVTLRARNWRDILRASTRAGAVPSAVADQIENALELLTAMAGNPRMLDIPLEFSGGRVYVGPVPVGTAPQFRLP